MALEERRRVVTLAGAALDALRRDMRGEVFAPGDAEYDSARQAWNLHARQSPAVIALVADVADVRTAVRFAGANGLPVAIMRTGHGLVAPCNGGLLLLTERLQGVEVDPATGIARIAAGALWSDVLAVSLSHGLIPLIGSTPYVGAVGYTLGGGLGWLARQHGMATDSVRAFDIVTADGELRRVTAETEPALFWAARGGGGAFGVVTSLECQLYPVDSLYGGNLFYPIEQAPAVLAAYGEWVKTLPEEFTTAFLMLRLPAMPGIPPQIGGQTLCVVRGLYDGDAAMGEALLRPMREAAPLVFDAFGPMPASELEKIASDPIDPMPVASWTETLRELDAATARTLIELMGSAPDVPFFAIEARHVGDSMAIQAPLRASAFSVRDAPFVLFTYGLLADPALEPAFTRYFAELTTALRPHTTGALYYNFLSDMDTTPERRRATHSPAHRRRLAAIKAVYDPANMFRYNQSVAPGDAAVGDDERGALRFA